jgi:hypothetical protein
LSGHSRLLVGALAASLAFGCAHAPDVKVLAPPPSQPLHLSPLVDLAPAAALTWLVEVHPRALTLDGRLAEAIARVLTEERLGAFKWATGGLDPRATDSVVIAAYPSTLLWLIHQSIDPARIEAAFKARLVAVEGRAEDVASGDRRTAITRLWGTLGAERLDLAIFGVEAVGVEQGRFGPLRAAELFSEGKLKRASPALRADPLLHLTELLGDAPLRAFAPGPFRGELERAAAGLLAACTAVGASARVVETASLSRTGLAVHVVLLGAWDADAEAASERLRAVFDILAESGIGRLFGLAHCLSGPLVHGAKEALTLDFTIDALELANGVSAATTAEVKTMMAP